MTFPKRLARWIDGLQGHAHAYACDYTAWWLEGGREPEIDHYVNEDDSRFTYAKAAKISARIRASV